MLAGVSVLLRFQELTVQPGSTKLCCKFKNILIYAPLHLTLNFEGGGGQLHTKFSHRTSRHNVLIEHILV